MKQGLTVKERDRPIKIHPIGLTSIKGCHCQFLSVGMKALCIRLKRPEEYQGRASLTNGEHFDSKKAKAKVTSIWL